MLAFSPAKLDGDVAVLDVPDFAETLPERFCPADEYGGGFGPKVSNHRHRRLLFLHRGRPRERGAASRKYDEVRRLMPPSGLGTRMVTPFQQHPLEGDKLKSNVPHFSNRFAELRAFRKWSDGRNGWQLTFSRKVRSQVRCTGHQRRCRHYKPGIRELHRRHTSVFLCP
jgi:hypothetical protein